MAFLDRLAGGMGDFGYGSSEAQRRAALARALSALGGQLTAGATRDGFGALGPAISSGFQAYQGGLADLQKQQIEEEERARQAERAALQDRYTGALITQAEANATTKEEQQEIARQKIQERAELIQSRRDLLAGLPPEKAGIRFRLDPLVGSDEWDDAWLKATETEKEPKLDRVSLSQGEDIYERDPATGSYRRVLSRPPAPRAEGSGPSPWAGIDYVTRGNQMVRVNKATGEIAPVYTFEQGEEGSGQKAANARKIFQSMIDNGDAVVGSDGTIDTGATWEAAQKIAGRKPEAPGALSQVEAAKKLSSAMDPADVQAVKGDLARYGETATRRALLLAGKSPAEIVALLKAAKKK